MIIPKFTYNNGSAVTFAPVWPPTKKDPVGPLVATRHDSITSSGIKQSVTERIDFMQVLNFEYVPSSDLAAWSEFMIFALAGGKFTYYPDATDSSTHSDYTIEDTTFDPKFICPGAYSLTMTMRLFV